MKDKSTLFCPNCKSKEVIPIMYGMPEPGMYEETDKKDVAFGGCVIKRGSPKWQCKKCGHSWGKYLG